MESTGSTTSKAKDSDVTIPKDHYKFFPSIAEQGLSDKANKKKLDGLCSKYLRPKQNDQKSLDIQKVWGSNFKDGLASMAKKDIESETAFIMDAIIYALYHEVVTDKSKYPKSVPFIDLPIEMIEYLIKKTQKCFEDEKSLVTFEAPVKIFGDLHG